MHMLFDLDIIATGGAGTLGRAIAERRKREGWTGKLTVYSTTTDKHEKMKQLYPDVNFVQGDIRNPETLYNAMVGHDVCLHLAAVKVIPASEVWSLDTIDVNINGSINVCVQARSAGIQHVVGISTDKAAHPVNAYGATKMLMEKTFHEYSRVESDTQYHLVRYGNVVESTGSVIEYWKASVARGEPIKITDPAMTRFWLSPQQAVSLVIQAMKLESGTTLIPKAEALSIGKLAEYTLDAKIIDENELYEKDAVQIRRIPMRPGEKMHEELLTSEEAEYATESDEYFFLRPTTSPRVETPCLPYSSDIAPELTETELAELLEG